ncbi:MAG TPA: zinc ribbon domain-containing protein [Gemmatimonadales bacterium]|nr:zinc ribbon domain-containing protein [Gemmatimonadales bacterium]
MPTYEYRCPDGHEFELMQKMSDPPRAKCPVCGRPAARQISGGAGLIFKGSGFYITDYGKDGKGPRQEKETEPKAPATPPATGDAAPKPEPLPKPEKPPTASKSARKKSKP